MKHGSLFSGIGGFDLAAERVGWENVFHCEINQFCKKVLKKHFPGAKSYENIINTDFSIHRGNCDIISGGFPCQPFSKAGKQKGTDDSRYLWPEMLRVIDEVQPRFVVGENVPGLISWDNGAVYRKICADLEDKGYEVQPITIPAYAVGSQQIRERIWFIGRRSVAQNTNTKRGELGDVSNKIEKEGAQDSSELSGNYAGLHWYETISRIHGIFNGISRRMDRHRNAALGNAIHPDIAVKIFEAILMTEPLTERRNDAK